MFQTNFNFSFKLINHSQITNKLFPKCLSTFESLIPVKLSSAIYESTNVNATSEPPFVVLHGLFGSKQNWSSLCKAYTKKLSPARHVIALDLRNHGESEHSNFHSYAHLAEDVKNFLSSNHIDKVALMGHSMGGRCAMLFALQYPELVEKLLIVDISPFTESPHLGQMPIILTSMERVQFPVNVTMSKARTIVDKQLAENIQDPSLRAFLLTNLIQTDNQRFKWRINIPTLAQNFDHIAEFPSNTNMQYTGETLFLGGGYSDFIPKLPSPVLEVDSLLPAPEMEGPLKKLATRASETCHESSNPKRLVYAVDLRNHGDSVHSQHNSYDDLVMDILKFLQTMDLKRVLLLGHDVGGRVGMLFSLKYPDLVEKLIVVDISPFTTSNSFQVIPEILKTLNGLALPREMTLQQAKLHVANHLSKFIKNRGQLMSVLMNLVQNSNGRYETSRCEIDTYRALIDYSWRFNIQALLEHFADLSSFPQIHNLTFSRPTLFIGGEKSDYIQQSDYPKIKTLFPKAELKYIEGAGHWVHSEKPNEFLKVTLEFLNQKNIVS